MKFCAIIGNVFEPDSGLQPTIELKSNAIPSRDLDRYVVRCGTVAFGLIFERLFGDLDAVTTENLMNCLFMNRVCPLYVGELELENYLVGQLTTSRSSI